jgi:uncharacterized membrane protein
LAAITAFGVGLFQLTAPKGTVPHRLIGWSWVMLMLAVAVSSLFIHKIRLWGLWSPIHLLSILVLGSCAVQLSARGAANRDGNQGGGLIGIRPTRDVDPLAGFQVFVMAEEVGDLIA